MTNQESGIRLPKNIRQIGTFGEKYQIYIEDFVYTYVHRFLHQRKREDAVLAAVLLGKVRTGGEREYVFISGAQKVDFAGTAQEANYDRTVQKGSVYGQEKYVQNVSGRSGDGQGGERLQSASGRSGDGQGGNLLQNAHGPDESGQEGERGISGEGIPDSVEARQEEFWDRVYQRIKNSFDDLDILGWYFNLDGGGLEVHAQLQQFFESTGEKGSRFLYYEDSLEKNDAFFVQEQHQLQRLPGYAVYYEKNPQMQQFMIEEKERMTPKPLRESYLREKSGDEAVQNYRAIMNRLNEKPPKRRLQPVVYVAGAAVLVIVAATAVTQIGNYQNLKVLQQTMQALSGAVNGEDAEEDMLSTEEETAGADAETDNEAAGVSAEEAESAEENSDASETGDGDSSESDSAADQSGSSDDAVSDTGNTAGTGTSDSAASSQNAAAEGTSSSSGESAAVTQSTSSAGGTSSYTVKEGDSLISISRSIYNTADMVDEICALNGIEDVDMIYVGQTLLLP
ncbi:MAG: LysM peptidoglycan-binding domain-containing protein [Clostridiales bacterium]|nr:LysM peptidoglycan-binding domain-containing protein [Clostridiales bacterium]